MASAAAIYQKLHQSYDGDDARLSVDLMEELAAEPIRTQEDAEVKARFLAEIINDKASIQAALARQLAQWLSVVMVMF